MLKPMLIVAMLAAPALADSGTVNVTCTLSQGKDSRHYVIKVIPGACGDARAKTPQLEDEIRVCVDRDGANDVRLDIDWKTQTDHHELRNHSVVKAQLGQTIDVDTNGTKLAIALQ